MKAFADGGGNRLGNCYYGIAVYQDDELLVRTGMDLPFVKTNNEAEYYALLAVLHLLRVNLRQAGVAFDKIIPKENIEIFMDSELVVNHVNGGYKVNAKNLRPLHTSVVDMLRTLRNMVKPCKVWLRHIPREENEEADKVGREALERARKA